MNTPLKAAEIALQVGGTTCTSCLGRVEKASLAALSVVIAGAAMAFSSVSVVGNTRWLRRWRPVESAKENP